MKMKANKVLVMAGLLAVMPMGIGNVSAASGAESNRDKPWRTSNSRPAPVILQRISPSITISSI